MDKTVVTSNARFEELAPSTLLPQAGQVQFGLGVLSFKKIIHQ
jgi:hypothetical protein